MASVQHTVLQLPGFTITLSGDEAYALFDQLNESRTPIYGSVLSLKGKLERVLFSTDYPQWDMPF